MIIFRKARTPDRTLNDLDAFLTTVNGEPARWLARQVQSWGEFSYEELAAAIEAGRMDDLIDWQERWAEVVNSVLAPGWAKAIEAASRKATRGKTVLSDSDDYVQSWIKNRGGELITLLSDESKLAVMNVVLRGQGLGMAPRQIAQQVRPLIGLTNNQAQANVRYREKLFQNLLGRGMSEEKAAARADKAALKYAGKQHRYRAETIVLTESAYAYNRGAHMGVSQSIADGYMGRCEMVWTTAGTNRVCGRCLELKDRVVGYTDESGVTLPPLHPRCRCAIMYREVGTKLPNVGSTRRTRFLTEKEAEAARVDEEKAFNAPTGADFGFNKMKRKPDWRNEIVITNMTEIATPNCQRCVVAHEARMRGYDVVARPSWGEGDTLCGTKTWLNAFKYSYTEFKECTGKTGDEVKESAEKIMRSFGEGARAIIVFKWDKNKTFADIEGHVIVTQCREKGNVIFGDPQTGKTAAAYQLNLANFAEKILLLRVDNLPFTDVVKRCCKNKE